MEVDDDMPIRLLRPSFSKGKTSSRKNAAADKDVYIAIQMKLKYVNSEIKKKKKMDENSNFQQRFMSAAKRATSLKELVS